MEITLKTTNISNQASFDLSWPKEKSLRLMFADGLYNVRELLVNTRLFIYWKLSCKDKYPEQTIHDVITEYNKICEKGKVSHLVVYGRNRVSVLTALLYSGDLPSGIPVLLAKSRLSRTELIAEQISHRLSPDDIRALPEYLDAMDSETKISTEILQKLYPQGELICPYQVDTEKYPFTNKF